MQDSNNENTTPLEPNRENDETIPTRVTPRRDQENHGVEAESASEEATIPVPVGRSANEKISEPHQVEATQPVTLARAVPAASEEISKTEPVTELPEEFGQKKKKIKGPRRWPWVILGLFLILLLGGLGSLAGYNSALQMRLAQKEEQKVTLAKEHFMLGLVAQSNKQYEIAKQQYEYVIRQDPSFPGVQDKLREVLIEMSMVRTPTPVPTLATPTLTPTLDTRPQEEIFSQAKAQYAAQDWEGLFATVDSLRRIDPTYHAVEIDGMLYMALRFRGISKILQQANLEGGLYDLALAERFGPLDVDAIGYRNWARQYLNGASFWEADWTKVMAYFEDIYPYFPNMRDSSGMTAIERYRIAASNQGDKLMAANDGCGAYDYYKKSLNAVNDPAVEQKAAEAFLLCYPPTATFTPTLPVTVTPAVITPGVTPVVETPQPTVEQPTTEPTASEPVEPTANPTPGP